MKKHVLVVMLVAVLFTGLIATITAPTVASSNGMVAAVNNYAAEPEPNTRNEATPSMRPSRSVWPWVL